MLWSSLRKELNRSIQFTEVFSVKTKIQEKVRNSDGNRWFEQLRISHWKFVLPNAISSPEAAIDRWHLGLNSIDEVEYESIVYLSNLRKLRKDRIDLLIQFLHLFTMLLFCFHGTNARVIWENEERINRRKGGDFWNLIATKHPITQLSVSVFIYIPYHYIHIAPSRHKRIVITEFQNCYILSMIIQNGQRSQMFLIKYSNSTGLDRVGNILLSILSSTSNQFGITSYW